MSLDKLTNTAASSHTQSARKRSLTWLLPVALLIGFLGVMALLFGKRLMPAVQVKTAPVVTVRLGDQTEAEDKKTPFKSPTTFTKGEMLFQASGWIEPDPYTTYVPTLLNGVVKEVFVLEGQAVKKGQILATLVDDDAILNLRQAEQKITSLKSQIRAHCAGTDISSAELVAVKKKIESLKAKLAEATDNHRRLASLPAGAVPQQQVVQARLAMTQQAASVAEAEAEIPRIRAELEKIEFERIAMNAQVDALKTDRDRAQLALDRTKIKAPIDAIVLHLHAAPGKKRMLDMDDPKSAVIVELYQPKKLQARIDVPLTEAAGLVIGQQVELVSDILPNATFKGQVTRITGEADLQRNTLQAKVSITNPDPRLRPEMLLRAKFYATGTATHSPTGQVSKTSSRLALYVPEAAIVSGTKVWVVSTTDHAELRTITLGQDKRDDHQRVLDGVMSGEQVILPPHTDLHDGVRVKTDTSK